MKTTIKEDCEYVATMYGYILFGKGVITGDQFAEEIGKYFGTKYPETTWAMGVASEHIKEISYNGQITRWSINNTKLTMELEN